MKSDETGADQRHANDHEAARKNQRQAVAGPAEADQGNRCESESEEAGGEFDFAVDPDVEDDAEVTGSCGQRENDGHREAKQPRKTSRRKPCAQ